MGFAYLFTKVINNRKKKHCIKIINSIDCLESDKKTNSTINNINDLDILQNGEGKSSAPPDSQKVSHFRYLYYIS